jgi:hypothetical protein
LANATADIFEFEIKQQEVMSSGEEFEYIFSFVKRIKNTK